jgi:uncharacterized protein (TIGR02284 family)
MPTPSKDLVEVEGTVRVLIEHLIDSQEGFQKVGDELETEPLKRYFLAESLQRAQFRGDLESILHQEGVHDIKETGTAAGTFARFWTGLKAKLGGTPHGLLESADEAEHSILEAYADALKKELPLPIREELVTQAAHIATTHEYIKAARDATK